MHSNLHEASWFCQCTQFVWLKFSPNCCYIFSQLALGCLKTWSVIFHVLTFFLMSRALTNFSLRIRSASLHKNYFSETKKENFGEYYTILCTNRDQTAIENLFCTVIDCVRHQCFPQQNLGKQLTNESL